jgi:Spy/CpxP family protein refolding chaperone
LTGGVFRRVAGESGAVFSMKEHAMKILTIIPLAVLMAGGLYAQAPREGPRGPRPGPPAVEELKNYLGLSDAQVESLQQLRRQEAESLRSVRQQMMEKQRALREVLRSGSSDAATVGQLQIDVQNLRQQVQESRQKSREQAVNSLTPEQRAKLQTLEEAAKLQRTIRQAGALNLLAAPAGGPAGPAMRRGMGPGMRFGPMGRRGAGPGSI